MAIDFDGTALAAGMEAFGEPVTYAPLAGAAYPIPLAIFTAAAKSVTWRDGVAFETVAPTLGARRVDFRAEPEPGDQLTARGIAYRVVQAYPDSVGHVHLVLVRAA